MENKIPTIQDYEVIGNSLAYINSSMLDFNTTIDKAIDLFNTNEIVQDFYNSGKYGSDIKERIDYIRKQVNILYETISKNLIPQTKAFAEKQIDLLSKSSRGYSTIESKKQRMEGRNE